MLIDWTYSQIGGSVVVLLLVTINQEIIGNQETLAFQHITQNKSSTFHYCQTPSHDMKWPSQGGLQLEPLHLSISLQNVLHEQDRHSTTHLTELHVVSVMLAVWP